MTLPAVLTLEAKDIDRYLRSQAGAGSIGPVDPQTADSPHVFFVDSGHANKSDNNTGNDPGAPLSTIDGAINKCTANRGDVILVMPGHAETISTASGIAADIAGVRIIGLGEGSTRPVLTFSATAATVVVSAAGVVIKNIVGTPSIDSVVSPFVVQAADCELDIEWQDSTNLIEAVRAILTTAAADRLKVNLVYRGFINGDAVVNAIRLVGVDGARIHVDFYGLCSTAVVEFLTTACSNVRVTGLFHVSGISLTRSVVDTITGSTWSVEGYDTVAGGPFSGGSGGAIAIDDISVITDALYGANGIATWPAAAAAANAVSIAEVLRYIEDILMNAAGVVTFPAGAAAANGVSLAEVLRYLQENVIVGTGTALPANSSLYGVLAGATGIPTYPAAAAAADNVSLAEVLRYIQDQIITGTGTVLPANQSLYDVLAGANGIATWAAQAAPANNVSLAEALRYVVETLVAALNTGTAQAGAAATITLVATASATDSLYNGAVIQLLTGLGAGQVRLITGYVGATKVATVTPAWTTAPDVTTTYVIRAVGPSRVEALTTGAIVAASFAAGAIDAAAIANGAIDAATFAAGAIDAAAIANAAIDAATFAAGAVDAAAIAANAITDAKIAAGAITAAKFAAGAIDAAAIANAAIDAATFAAGAIDAAAIADNAIDAGAIAAGAITAAKFAAGAVDAAALGADALTNAKIADNALASEQFALSAGERTTEGIVVTKATAALPQTAAAAIFTVTGLVKVIRIVGYVTTVVGAVANATKLVGNSTGAGASTDLCLTLDINGHAVDSRYEITGAFGAAMVRTLDVPLAPVQTTDIVIPPGTIDLNCAGSDGGTGRVRWSVTYVPMEAGAQIVAA